MCLNQYILDQNPRLSSYTIGMTYFELYFASSRMWRLSTYFEEGSMLESIGINSIWDSLDQVESQMDSNDIHYFEFQTWNQTFQPA